MKIYFAAKMASASIGRTIRTNWKPYNIEIVSGWLDQDQYEDDATHEGFAYHWLRDDWDVRKADLVLLYSHSPDDELRGALVEAGMALGQNKPVLPVGENPHLGTWRHHPLVLPVKPNLESALMHLIHLSL